LLDVEMPNVARVPVKIEAGNVISPPGLFLNIGTST
jgi:hypothetical protein